MIRRAEEHACYQYIRTKKRCENNLFPSFYHLQSYKTIITISKKQKSSKIQQQGFSVKMLHCVSLFVVRFAPLECTNRTADRSRPFFIAKNCSNKKTLKSCPSTVFSFSGETLFVHFDIDSCCYKERKWDQFVSPLLRRRLGPPCSHFLWLSRSVQVRKYFAKNQKFLMPP